MEIIGIIWLEDIVEKLAFKHHIMESEVLKILKNKPIGLLKKAIFLMSIYMLLSVRPTLGDI